MAIRHPGNAVDVADPRRFRRGEAAQAMMKETEATR